MKVLNEILAIIKEHPLIESTRVLASRASIRLQRKLHSITVRCVCEP